MLTNQQTDSELEELPPCEDHALPSDSRMESSPPDSVSTAERQRRDGAFLIALGEHIQKLDSASEILTYAAESLGAYLKASRCTFGDIDLAAGIATIHPGYEPGQRSVAGTYALPDFARDSSQALSGGHTVVLEDTQSDPRTRDRYEAAYRPVRARAGVHVPLMRERRWVGVFSVVVSEVRRWSEREVYLIQAAAERAWLWIERVRAEDALRTLNAELERRVEERTRQIRSSLREKEVLLKEVHHRVKNNLQVVSSLLNLQAHHVADPELRRMLAQSQGRILSIALVHEKLYQSKDLSHVDFAEYVRTISSQLFRASDAEKRVGCVLDLDEVRLPVDRAIPCGLILNELITNSLRHAFPDGRCGRLLIALKRTGTRELELRVEDDGLGFAPGFDVRTAATLGLELVFTFAEQLDAEVKLGSQGGASFCFRFTGDSE